MSDDWFRRPGWDDAERDDFEQRLARARPGNRQQYLRIKALVLRDSGEIDGAESLLRRVIDQPDGYAHEAASATEALGDIAAQRGDLELAKRYYRRTLAEQPSLSGTSGNVEISLAEALIAEDASTDLIRVAEQTGDQDTIRTAATTALRLACRGPQLARHKDIGVVEADAAMLSRLRELTE